MARIGKMDYSKQILNDEHRLLWVVTVGGLLLAAYCVFKDYMGALPWVTAMVGLPWTAHGTSASFYYNMCKSDHKDGGITMEAARANGFQQDNQENVVSPKI